jgi:hypothetical protein
MRHPNEYKSEDVTRTSSRAYSGANAQCKYVPIRGRQMDVPM